MSIIAKLESLKARISPGSVTQGLAQLAETLSSPVPQVLTQLVDACGTKPVLFDAMVAFRPANPTPWDSDGKQSLEELYDVGTVLSLLDRYEGRISDSVVPIGDAGGGNQICFGLRDGQIYFWDHEDERPEESSYTGNLYLVATSLEDFLDRLFMEEEDAAPEVDGLLGMRLDDDL